MTKTATIVSAVLIWFASIWLFGAAGTLALVIDQRTGEKYCINPLANSLGMQDSSWFMPFLTIASLTAFLSIPAIMIWLFLRTRRAAKRSPIAGSQRAQE
jgi:hypothetical protein